MTGPEDGVTVPAEVLAFYEWRAQYDGDWMNVQAAFKGGWDAAQEAARDEAAMHQAVDWHAGYAAGRDSRWNGLFRRLGWLPKPAYYLLLDRLTSNNGWRPLSIRERQS